MDRALAKCSCGEGIPAHQQVWLRTLPWRLDVTSLVYCQYCMLASIDEIRRVIYEYRWLYTIFVLPFVLSS